MRNNLFEPVVATFLANGERYNLLNSAVLEMVEFIRKENIKPLISHLVEQFGPRLSVCTYVDTFRNLKLKYEQNQVRLLPECNTRSFTLLGGFHSTAAEAAEVLWLFKIIQF